MAGTPETIVLDPQKTNLEKAESTQIRAKMLQDSVGSVGKNIMDMVTQYQELKINKQKQDLASMTAAGSMVGGMDNLPQEAKNKLPGILGVPLPTNANGDVQVTPDLDTLIKRSAIGLLQNDPDAAKIFTGMQEKHTDPLKLASDQKIGEMRLAGTREKIAADAAKAALDNDTRIQQTIISGQYRLGAAATSAKGSTDAATIRANQVKSDQLPSPFVLDPKSNTLMSEPQWYSTYPDKVMPTKLSNGDVKAISGQQRAAAATAASNASVEANRARVDTAHFQLTKLLAGKETDAATKQLKLLVDSYRLSKDTAQEPHMKALLETEIPKLLKQGGMSDEDLAPLTAAVGEGGWADAATNLFNSAYGYTSTGSKPSLLQPVVASIPGLHPSLVGAVAGFFRGKPKPKAAAPAAPAAPSGGQNLSFADFQKQYPQQ